MALTPRQKEVLDFIAGFVNQNGYCPSYEEIARGLGLASLATVHKHISALEARGYLLRTFNQSRSLELSQKYFNERPESRLAPGVSLEMPLAGRIAAGAPVETFEGNETLSFADFVGASDTFALQVRGESMIDDHICDGDYVLVQKAAQARNGEIVVALVAGAETTLKRFYAEAEGMVRLQPANSSMAPILRHAADVQVQGRVLAVLRKYR